MFWKIKPCFERASGSDQGMEKFQVLPNTVCFVCCHKNLQEKSEDRFLSLLFLGHANMILFEHLQCSGDCVLRKQTNKCAYKLLFSSRASGAFSFLPSSAVALSYSQGRYSGLRGQRVTEKNLKHHRKLFNCSVFSKPIPDCVCLGWF